MTLLLPKANPTQGRTRSAGIPSQAPRSQRCIHSSPARANRLAMVLKVVLNEGRERFRAKRMQSSKFSVSESRLWKREPLLIYRRVEGFLVGEPRLVFLINSRASGEGRVERSPNGGLVIGKDNHRAGN